MGLYLRLEISAPLYELLEGRCEDFLSTRSDQDSKCSISICQTDGS